MAKEAEKTPHPLRDIEENTGVNNSCCDNSQCVDEETGCGLGREIRAANLGTSYFVKTIRHRIEEKLPPHIRLSEEQMKEAILLRLGIFTEEEKQESFRILGADTPEKQQFYRTELTEDEQKLFERTVFDVWASSMPLPFTAKVCAAPCQSSCTRSSRTVGDGSNDKPVPIRTNELTACLVGMRYAFFDKYFPSALNIQVSRLCDTMARMQPNTRKALTSAINALLDNKLDKPLVSVTLGTAKTRLANAIASAYPTRTGKSLDSLEQFLAALKEQMKENYPLTAYENYSKNIAVVGSGPAGWAVALGALLDGHNVTVFERNERFGGLLTFGIPDKKLEKPFVEYFLKKFQGMEQLTMHANQEFTAEDRKNFDMAVLAVGVMDSVRKHEKAEVNEHPNVVQAMPFLTEHTKYVYHTRTRFQQPYQRAIELKPGQITIIAGAGDTATDALTVSGEQQEELAQKGQNPGKVIAIDRNIKRTHVSPAGVSSRWPNKREVVDTDRQKALDYAMKAEEEFAVRITDVYPTAKGVPVTHVQLEYLKPKDPNMTQLSKEQRVMVRDTARGGQTGKKPNQHPETHQPSEAGTKWKRVDTIILAYGSEGMKENKLVKALGLTVDPKSGKLQNVRNTMTQIPGIFVAGDCDPDVRRWTLEAAQGSARNCVEAIRQYLDNPEKGWEECRNTKLPAPRRSMALAVGGREEISYSYA